MFVVVIIYIMNIFFTDCNPRQCAIEHVDRHVIKMTLEYAQILSSAHRYYRGSPGELIHPSKGILLEHYPYVLEEERDSKEATLCLMAHMNHPCSIWARTNSINYQWLYWLYVELCGEYFYRYGQYHSPPKQIANYRHADLLYDVPEGMPEADQITPPPQCMPDEFKRSSPIDAYRQYIQHGKNSSMHTWKERNPPEWWELTYA